MIGQCPHVMIFGPHRANCDCPACSARKVASDAEMAKFADRIANLPKVEADELQGFLDEYRAKLPGEESTK